MFNGFPDGGRLASKVEGLNGTRSARKTRRMLRLDASDALNEHKGASFLAGEERRFRPPIVELTAGVGGVCGGRPLQVSVAIGCPLSHSNAYLERCIADKKALSYQVRPI